MFQHVLTVTAGESESAGEYAGTLGNVQNAMNVTELPFANFGYIEAQGNVGVALVNILIIKTDSAPDGEERQLFIKIKMGVGGKNNTFPYKYNMPNGLRAKSLP